MSNKAYRVSFVGNVQKGGHTEYSIRVQDCGGLTSWFISKRYREIRELHDIMKLQYPHNLTWFPPKRYFGNSDGNFIDERQSELQRYMDGVLEVDPHATTKIFYNFLDIPNHIGKEPKPPPPSFVVPTSLCDKNTAKDNNIYITNLLDAKLLDLSVLPTNTYNKDKLNDIMHLYSYILYHSDLHLEKREEGKQKQESDTNAGLEGLKAVVKHVGSQDEAKGLISRAIDKSILNELYMNNVNWIDVDTSDYFNDFVLGPSLATSAYGVGLYEGMCTLASINDPGRAIHGVGTLKSGFPQYPETWH